MSQLNNKILGPHVTAGIEGKKNFISTLSFRVINLALPPHLCRYETTVITTEVVRSPGRSEMKTPSSLPHPLSLTRPLSSLHLPSRLSITHSHAISNG